MGTTAAGGDYYYSYGDGLFIVLNTNNYNVAEHQKANRGGCRFGLPGCQHGEL